MDLYEDEQLESGSNNTSIFEKGRDVVIRASSDHAVTGDPRALRHLTALEKSRRVTSYFDTVQTRIQPHMRKILAVWMFQVYT